MFSTSRTRIEALERMVAQLVGGLEAVKLQCVALTERVERGSTVQIRSDLDNLVGRVESLAASNRKEFGRLHAARTPRPPGADAADDNIDAELAEQIKFQRDWSAN